MNPIVKYMKQNGALYLFLVPAVLFFLVFRYVPLGYMAIAFKDFNIFDGFARSEWVGLKHFIVMFQNPEFYQLLWNTLIISFQKLLFVFTAPILIALLLNEIRMEFFKRFVQTMVFLPHFLSWVIIYSVFFGIFSGSGVINNILSDLGLEKIFFFVDKDYFRGILVSTEVWKATGWRTVLYLAALSGIDPQLYEAAVIDGAGRFRRIIHITIPCLIPTIFTVLILYIGYVMTANFEQIVVMYNPQVYPVADILQTNVYRNGFGRMQFSAGAAVGIFNSILVFLLALGANRASRKFTERSIW